MCKVHVLCRREAQNEKIKRPFLQELTSQWEGWVCKGTDSELAEKLSKSPEVDHVQGGNFAARLETMELLDLAED